MAKCISCGSDKAQYQHYNGGYVCPNCIGRYFQCPDCGLAFDMDDYENGDAGNGFCAKDAPNH